MTAGGDPVPSAQVPRATYRLQFNEHFRLSDGLSLIPYLRDLGVSHVYASPLLKACPHSGHGYDVCDFQRLNPELGTEKDLEQFVGALREAGMGLVLDIVPNHMGIGGPENRWWWDVLMHGPASPFADYFDIDWQSPNPRLRGKILLPVLGDTCERVLERGEMRVAAEGGALVLRYFDHRFPITPCSWPEDYPPGESESPALAAAITTINGNAYALHHLIRQQYYVPACWREADAGLNYRRFFNIASLAGLRTESKKVFNDSHALIQKWFEKGWLDGLRVDHPDGLRDPEQYTRRLRAIAPGAWIVLEKILERGENLPAWPVNGTSGYDFLNRVGGLFIDPEGERALTDFYAEFTDETTDYAEVMRQKKRLVLRKVLAAEVTRLTRLMARITERAGNKFAPDELREALIESIAEFPIYRTYAQPETEKIAETDVACIEHAIAAAREQRPELDAELFSFLADLLLLRQRGLLESDFVLRFQQLTVPVMAKGVEDTALYCFNRLAALNEVGGDPGHFGLSVEAFHDASRMMAKAWPHSMLATSTHDTKRSEDTRARMSLLAEIPEAWIQAVSRWAAMNERHRRDGWPDRNAEYLFYQTLVGAWPLSLERVLAYMQKAACEAKQHTTWSDRNEPYEQALQEFATGALADAEFIRDFETFLGPLTEAARVNSLAQTLIKLTAPGVPDIYQGCELWDLSLVDPDNRRPVDFKMRRQLLAETKRLTVEEVWRRRVEGLPKLWVIQKALELRAREPKWFDGTSGYEALRTRGAKSEHVAAFARGGKLIAVVPRLPLRLKNDWADTAIRLPPGSWRNAFSGEDALKGNVSVAEVLQKFPVALLMQTEPPQ